MTKAEAIKQVYEQFADYLNRGFTVAESYEKIFGEGSYSNLIDWAYDALRAKGNS